MNPTVLSAIIAGIVSLIVSSVIAVWVQRKKLASDYDLLLRNERLTEYRKLRELTEPLGWYGNHEINNDTMKELLTKLDHWYFENGGGLLLSDLSIIIFEELLFSLNSFQNNASEIRKKATKLRSALSFDIGGRKQSLLHPKIEMKELEKRILLQKEGTDNDSSNKQSTKNT